MKSLRWFVALAGAALPLAAQTVQFGELLSFAGGPAGSTPAGALVSSGGQLFGTTSAGGDSTACINGCGTVYSLTPPVAPGSRWTQTVIYSFAGGTDGSFPASGLTLGSGGVLYGAVRNGGASDRGAIFELTPSPDGTWQMTVLHNFAGGDDGSYPAGTLALGNHGELYGTTMQGDADGAGTVFSLTPPTGSGGHWIKTLLYAFAGGADGTNPNKGVALDLNTGVIYGATREGGTLNFGTVFSLTPPSSPGGFWVKTTLYNFANANDGAYPNGVLLGNTGALYGTTAGYSDQGTVFALEPHPSPGGPWTLQVLHDFANDFIDGAQPTVGLTRGNGALYGVTLLGGTDENCACGTAFSLTPPASPGGGWKYALLYSFAAPGGVAPAAPLLYGDSGLLYGTTSFGGSHGYGTVFELQVK